MDSIHVPSTVYTYTGLKGIHRLLTLLLVMQAVNTSVWSCYQSHPHYYDDGTLTQDAQNVAWPFGFIPFHYKEKETAYNFLC